MKRIIQELGGEDEDSEQVMVSDEDLDVDVYKSLTEWADEYH